MVANINKYLLMLSYGCLFLRAAKLQKVERKTKKNVCFFCDNVQKLP